MVIPGFSRPITGNISELPGDSCTVCGTQAAARLGNSNPGGMTPITTLRTPFSVTSRPITEGSALKWTRHNGSLSTTVGSAPLPASSSVKVRPSAGATPSTAKNSLVTLPALTSTGSAAPARLPSKVEKVARLANAVLWPRSAT